MMGQVLAFMAGVAFARGTKRKTEAPPATTTHKPTTSTPAPSKPAQVPWPQEGEVPQVGPRGGKEPPKAQQKKSGAEERKKHEHAIAKLKAERAQRVAELKKAGEADPSAKHALQQRIHDIDQEIAARKAAIAKLPA